MKHLGEPLAMVVAALTIFAVLLILAHVQRPWPRGVWIGLLVVSLYALSGPTKVVAPLAAILSLAVSESLAGMRPE